MLEVSSYSAVGSEPPAPGRVFVWRLKGRTEGRWTDGRMDKGISCKVHWKVENEKLKKKEAAAAAAAAAFKDHCLTELQIALK